MTNENGRMQVNFNRDWKFIREDAADAQKKEYDDSKWVSVGIPHNFSIPYEMSAQFYVGYGWYRKSFDVPESWNKKRIELEFEGVFQEAEIYVNETHIGTHRGGYSGFVYNITEYLHPGKNILAVRVNNIWHHDLAPRSGDHQFTGGIYRNVYLNVTSEVHVTWYGTFVTTPDLTNPGFDSGAENIDFSQFPSEEEIRADIAAKQSNVRVRTEVINEAETPKIVQALHKVKNTAGKTVAEFASEPRTLNAGEIYEFDALSEKIHGIELWSVEHPVMYLAHTTVLSDGVPSDTYETTFGFRWAQYRKDAFYLNGQKIFINGANVHQDHAGFADAVTDAGFYRDAAMVKECGMNFIRGSHYPHAPAFANACDELGILFWSECNFWGMGGCAGKDADAVGDAVDWLKDAYPQNPEHEEKFEQSCMDSLEAMIRVNRNHPSIINWSMANEVFFTSRDTQNKAKALVNRMRNAGHRLDPTRKSGMGGCQREGYDSLEICDIAGYNGDGGKFENLTMPNFVAEYGSQVQNRPGEYRPYYDQIEGDSETEFTLQKNSAGICVWCAFHHGTVGGDGLAKMGIIDYYRLPMNSWYWCRERNTGVPGEFSRDGRAVQMELTASDTVITNDGKKDTRLVVTMKDAEGNWVNDTRSVTLTVEKGPGIFPGGKIYTFIPDESIRDGKASIEFRSYYAGTTVIKAQAEGLPDAEIVIHTEDAAGAADYVEPENFYNAFMWKRASDRKKETFVYGGANAVVGRPVFPSSNKLQGELAADGNPETSWVAGNCGSGEYFEVDLEFTLFVYKIGLGFEKAPYPYKVETALDKKEGWSTIAEYTKDTISERAEEESVDGREVRYVRVTFTDVPEEEKAFLSEIEVYGNIAAQAPQYAAEGKNLSAEDRTGNHSGGAFIYRPESKYSLFSGTAGNNNEAEKVTFRIYADDVLIYEKELSGKESEDFNLNISRVDTLQLMTEAGAEWTDLKLYGAARDVSLDGSKRKCYMSVMTPCLLAGEKYPLLVQIENTGDQEELCAAFTVFDKQGNAVNKAEKSVKTEAGKICAVKLQPEMPETLDGCYGELLIRKKHTGEAVSKCTKVFPGQK